MSSTYSADLTHVDERAHDDGLNGLLLFTENNM